MTGDSTTSDKGLVLSIVRPLDQSPAAVYLASLSPGSRRTMRAALDTIAGLLSGQADALAFDWAALRFQHTAAIRARLAPDDTRGLAETYAPATANKMLAALRGTLKAAWRLGQMDAETYRRAVDLEPARGERLPAGRNLSQGEIAAMFAVCANDPSPAGARDAAILALLRLGLRRQEVAGLELADYDQGEGAIKVRGKGGKERAVPLMNGAAAAVDDWLALRLALSSSKGDRPGPLLLAVNKGGRIQLPEGGLRSVDGLTSQAVNNVLIKRAQQAGVQELSPHDWRRTFAGDLLDAGADLVTVQKPMGHASPITTARYDRRPEAARRRAVDMLHVPYRRRGQMEGRPVSR